MLICPEEKTASPLYEVDRHLRRPRLESRVEPNIRKIALQAKIGQGKSVFAAQLHQKAGAAGFWYRIDRDDNDPLILMQRIIGAIQREMGASLNDIEQQVRASGEPDLTGIRDQVAAVLNKVDTSVSIVFDDLHLLDSGSESLALLLGLVELLDDVVRVVLASRIPIALDPEGESLLMLSDDDLAFTAEEAVLLSSDILGQESSFQTAVVAHRYCHGWPVVLCELLAAIDSTSVDSIAPQAEEVAATTLQRLEREHLDVELVDVLARLSLRPKPGAGLIARCAGDAAPRLLAGLPIFGDLVRRLPAGDIEINELLRSWLRRRLQPASEEFQALIELHLSEARRSGNWQEMFELLVLLGDLARLDEFLKDHMDSLIQEGRFDELLVTLERLGPDQSVDHPHLMLFWGRALAEISPIKAERWLRLSREGFAKSGDEPGELRAIAHRAALQMNLAVGLRLQDYEYPRMAELLKRHGQTLNRNDEITLKLVDVGRLVYIDADSEAANRGMDDVAITLALGDWPNEFVRNESYRATDHIFHQRPNAALDVIERISQIDATRLTATSKIHIAAMRANWFSMIGDRACLMSVVEETFSEMDREIFEQGQVCGAFYEWLADSALSTGDYSGAISIINRARNTLAFTVDGDWKNHGRWLMALAQAACGNQNEARHELGLVDGFSATRTFALRQRLFMAATNHYLGEPEQALALLEEVLSADEYPQFITVASGIKYQVLREQGDDVARPWLARWVEGVADTVQFPRFFAVGYTRGLMELLIKEGGKYYADNGGFRREAESIARRYMGASLQDDYSLFPTLRIQTGPIARFYVGSTEIKLTKTQTLLMYLLVFARESELSVAELKRRLWQEADEADSRFYAMISRLKKAIAAAGADPALYLEQRQGYIRLKNIEVDVHRFEAEYGRSEQLRRQGKSWFADCVGFTALASWSGLFEPDMQLVDVLSSQLQRRALGYRQLCRRLLPFALRSTARVDRLIRYIEPLFDEDRADGPLAQTLTTLYRATGDMASIVATRARYRDGLKAIDVPEEEATRLVAELDQDRRRETDF